MKDETSAVTSTPPSRWFVLAWDVREAFRLRVVACWVAAGVVAAPVATLVGLVLWHSYVTPDTRSFWVSVAAGVMFTLAAISFIPGEARRAVVAAIVGLLLFCAVFHHADVRQLDLMECRNSFLAGLVAAMPFLPRGAGGPGPDGSARE